LWVPVLGAATLATILSQRTVHGQESSEEKSQEVIVSEGMSSTTEETAAQAPAPKKKRGKKKYIIVGAGAAGFSALSEILDKEPEAEVLIISAEEHYPYAKPPLSKELWRAGSNDSTEEGPRFETSEGVTQSLYFEDQETRDKYTNVQWMLNTSVTDIDVRKRLMLLSDGSVYEYQKCLIATGSVPEMLPYVPEDLDHKITYLTNLSDYNKLVNVVNNSDSIAILGGQFLGAELACSLASQKKKKLNVTNVFPEAGIMSDVFPGYLSEYIENKMINDLGVNIKHSSIIDKISSNDNHKIEINLSNGDHVIADHLVVCMGVIPSVEFAEKDLEIDAFNGGIVANAELESRSDVFVAGDVVSYYDMVMKRRRRVQHYDHAVRSGEIAAMNMMGRKIPYNHFPMYWSELHDLHYEGVGITDSTLPTVSVWEDNNNKDYKKGVVYYIEDQRIVGAILIGLPGKGQQLRHMISNALPYHDYSDLKNLVSFKNNDSSE